ncbi:MAG: 3-deoxy-8-phosphooctulonate synthase [Verrucomicrobia bacterium]|jgi:2-dehydro-3-deoxyphosphooctonate aldolase (KDO 8-P synthase)|nr:3-deoxy-8-phosphooctulonate synthase [Verrucomicrobiota bacterium]
MGKRILIGGVGIGGRSPLALIAGPCVIESRKGCLALAGRLAALAESEGIPFIFKASYDKANRTSVDSYRGPGIVEGLEILQAVREQYGVPITTDVHTAEEATLAARVVDAIQIPAFLCRQTDLLLAAGESGIPVNIKKGQFLAPADMVNVVGKVESTGNRKIILTERGASFGYNNLVADMRSLLELREFGYPVTFDATHSVQRPGAGGTKSGGDSRWAPYLARAAVAVGCNAVFIETHVRPEKALSDGANAIRFSNMKKLWQTLRAIDDVVS